MLNNIFKNLSIKYKVSFFICLTSLIVVLLGVILGYYFGIKAMEDNILRNYSEMSKILANSVSILLNNEIINTQMLINTKGIKNELIKANLSYKDLSVEDIKNSFLEKDKLWITGDKNNWIFKKYLENDFSKFLRKTIKIENNIAEIFITDKYGGLVMSSHRTSDYYQADEKWWQEAYNNGYGKTTINEIEYDSSSKSWSLPISIPIKDNKGEVIGVCKNVVNLEFFFTPLKSLKIGKTGHATMVDKDGLFVFHENFPSMTVNRFKNADKSIKDTFVSNKKICKTGIFETSIYNKKIYYSCSIVDHAYLKEKSILWNVCVDQDLDEVLKPVRLMLSQAAVLTPFLLLIMAILGFVFAEIFIRPIKILRNATKRISKGDLAYKLNIESKDEIGQLSESFNEMTEKLKNMIATKETLESEINERKRIEQEFKKANEELAKNEEVLKKMINEVKQANDDLKNAQIKLIQSEKLASLGQLISGIAHEINNPIGFIDSNIEILSQYVLCYKELLKVLSYLKLAIENGNDEEARELVYKINNIEDMSNFDFVYNDIENLIRETRGGAQRIKKIIDDLRSFSRKDEDQMELNNIEEIIDGAIDIVWNEVKYKAEIIKQYSGLPLIESNKQKLGQVFINLLVNAAQSMQDKGEIRIKTYSIYKYAYIEISDSGNGILKEDINKIFDPFFTTKDVGKGTGLGLSISYEIIKQHKGEIFVESEIDKGTTFIIMLPINYI